jgi:hypothetical protein
MALVKEYIDRYREDRQEQDLIKILETGLLKAVGEYARKKGWKNPEEWISNILNDPQLGDQTQDFWIQALLSRGYYHPQVVKEALDFERGSDPKKILQLGILQQILIYAQHKCQEEKDWSWSSPSGWLWEIQEDKNIPMKAKIAWYDYLREHPEYLKISMDEQGNVLSEALDFERGLAPKQSLGIGLEEQIRNFLDDKTSSSPSLWISYLLNEGTDEELDQETRNQWIKFLITKPEYNKDLDENDYLELKERGIEWIPFAPFKDDNFKYKFTGNSYILYFKEWSDFADYFDTDSRDISPQFIEAVLGKEDEDAYEYFDYDIREHRDITDFAWHINRILQKGKQIPALKVLKKKAIKMGADPHKVKTIDDLLEEIQENEDLSDLCDAVRFAYVEAMALADESEAYRDLQRAIKKHYHIGDAKYDESKEFFIAPCDFDGIKLLSFTLATGEDKIKYYPPQSYNGDMTMEDINDSLANKLEDV